MCLRFLKSTLCLAILLVTTGCEREQRQFSEPASSSAPVQSVRLTPQQPGPQTPVIATDAPYAENAYALNEGKRLYLGLQLRRLPLSRRRWDGTTAHGRSLDLRLRSLEHLQHYR